MRVVVTGGAGFIGSCLVGKLNEQGIDDVIVVDVGDENKHSDNLKYKKIIGYIERDEFLKQAESDKLDKSIDMIVHFGACADTTEIDIEYLKKNNYLYSKELAQWSLKNNKRFLYASSAATYGAGELDYSDDDELAPRLRPLNEYGRSKQIFDLWVLENKLQESLVGFKFFNVYGPNEYHKADMHSMVNKGYHQIKDTGKLRLFKSHKDGYGDGEQRRDFIYIKDALEMVWYFIDNPGKNGIVNIGTGHSHTWNELAGALFAALGLEPNIEYFDMPDNIKDHYQYFTEADLSKLRRTGCDYKTTDINEAVKDYVKYLNKNEYL